ncbi:unnamed protein product, partial [marine sediment metagenome]
IVRTYRRSTIEPFYEGEASKFRWQHKQTDTDFDIIGFEVMGLAEGREWSTG